MQINRHSILILQTDIHYRINFVHDLWGCFLINDYMWKYISKGNHLRLLA